MKAVCLLKNYLMSIEDFYEQAKQAEEDILEGSLEGSRPTSQQVHRTSWKYLAKINGLGLLTYTSQDALSGPSKEANFSERAYVKGYMPVQLARRFATIFNIEHNDMMATLAVPIEKTILKALVAQGRYLGITNRHVDETTGKWNKVRGVMPSINYMLKPMSSIISEPPGIAVGVEVIDLKWGRSATSKKGLWKAVIHALLNSYEEKI